MGILGRIANRLRSRTAPTRFDAVTTALLAPGRAAFRSLFADDAPQATAIAVDNAAELDAALARFVAHADPGDTLTIEVPNAPVAELEGLAIGMTPAQLNAALERMGLDITDRYGIGSVPQSLAKRKPFFKELGANPSVFATPTDCVLLAYRCRKPFDAIA
jgi:hypothetical protein